MNISHDNTEFHQFGLSPRQSEVFLMISNGYSNKEIAAALEISPETVKTHLKVIFHRTKIRKRTEASRLIGWA
ncbi:MAG: LuxR C-terminal-related transcriptional regulator [Acidiferrobacterales bacterium]|nr:LuxR C-terminal-related transcriptional regulator [Acidiferrobacterales bacterium]